MQFLKQHKVPAIIAAALIVAGLVLFFVLRGAPGGSAGGVYVQPVRDLAGGIGSVSRFSGVAESQKTEKVLRDSQKAVKEIFVAAGDSVKKGDKLFAYDTELMKLDVQQAQLEIESMQTTVSTANSQIAQYQRERAGVSGSERMAYDTQIQQLQAEINSTNYQIKTKQLELERLQASLERAEILSPVDGVVEAVGTIAEPLDMENTMVTLRNGGNLRIKGSISEQNVMAVSVGDPVIVRSRVDRDQTWTGVIESIDTGSAEKNENNNFHKDPGAERASFYAFYVTLDDAEGIIMGQHVIIEPDYGQGETREGLWLPAGFVADPEGDAYVWAANSRMKLQRRPVTLGAYDVELDMFQIVEGLEADDLIAWPDENCVSGAAATTELVWDEPDFDDDFYEGSFEPFDEGKEFFDGAMIGDEPVEDAPAGPAG